MTESLDDLDVLVAVVRAGSFTQAAAELGVSQPALSRTLRKLEERLGTRLLNRTTRSIAPTEAGASLLSELSRALDTIKAAVDRLLSTGDEPAGTVRLTVDRHGHDMILAAMLPRFLADHPRVAVEVSVNDAFVDLLGRGFDAGLRLGDFVERDMIAARVGPDVEVAIVGSPAYFDAAGKQPVTPRDLAAHACIAYRRPRTGGFDAWRFEREGRHLSVRVGGRLVLNDGEAIMAAALGGVGIAYLYLDQVTDHLAAGRLIRVLADWCPPMPGFRLYYPDRRNQPPALAALIRYLRASAESTST